MSYRPPPRPARPSRLVAALIILMAAVGSGVSVSGAGNGVTDSAAVTPRSAAATTDTPSARASAPRTILFIGNSFTYAHGSALRFYRPETVIDLNNSGIGGVPALFKSFTDQAGLSYEVFLETHPSVGLEWHLDNERAVIDQRPWDIVVLQSFSTLDARKPGDPALLVSAVRRLATLFRAKNPSVELRLTSTWPRADLTYEPHGAYYGKPIEAMARDVRAGYDLAAAGTPGIAGVVPVGDAWVRAFHSGVADPDPYDGIDAGKMDLWTYDHYHASTYGYYLEALMLFGKITGRDPRSLGDHECSAFELGIWPAQAAALQTVAFEQLAAEGPMAASPHVTSAPGEPERCETH